MKRGGEDLVMQKSIDPDASSHHRRRFCLDRLRRTRAIKPVPRSTNRYRKEWDIGDRLLVMYSGNFGLGHDVDWLGQLFLHADPELARRQGDGRTLGGRRPNPICVCRWRHDQKSRRFHRRSICESFATPGSTFNRSLREHCSRWDLYQQLVNSWTKLLARSRTTSCLTNHQFAKKCVEAESVASWSHANCRSPAPRVLAAGRPALFIGSSTSFE